MSSAHPLWPLVASTVVGVLGLSLVLAGNLGASGPAARHLGTSAIAMPPTGVGVARPRVQAANYRAGDETLFRRPALHRPEPASEAAVSLSAKVELLLEGTEPLSDVTILTLDALSRARLVRRGRPARVREGAVCPSRANRRGVETAPAPFPPHRKGPDLHAS